MHPLSPSFSRKQMQLVSPYIHIPENVRTFDFDTYDISECFVLKNIAGYIFKTILENIELKINEENLVKFIDLVSENYNFNDFHNFQHAINVLQMTYMLLTETEFIRKLKPTIVFGILISALSHDIDHPGNTNSYEINSFSKLAKLYNDNSVLENHHCTLTFQLLEHTNLLNCFKGDDFREFRKTIIQCILGTDMAKHNDFTINLNSFDFNKEHYNDNEQYFIASSILHYADLSNCIKDFEANYEWSKRISLEFYKQSIKEELEGLPSLSFMKIHDKVTMCLNEISFISKISIPMWESFSIKFPKIEILYRRCQSNLNKWREIETTFTTENDINNFNY